jgi:hypothetical protein
MIFYIMGLLGMIGIIILLKKWEIKRGLIVKQQTSRQVTAPVPISGQG